MLINQARMAAVALALTSSVTLADGFHQEFQKGFYVGLSTGASFVNGQTSFRVVKDDIDGPLEDTTAFYRDEASARGYNGGVTIGWDFYCDREYIYGVALSGNVYSNRAHQNWWSAGEYNGTVAPGGLPGVQLQNFEQSWDMRYSADLTFQPGWFVSDSTKLYAIIGGSVARVNAEIKNVSRNESEDFTTLEDKETVYGFVIGAGIQKQLCNRLSAFASYQYTYYDKIDLRDALEDPDELPAGGGQDPTFIDHSKLRIDTNVFKVGLLYTF